MNVSGTVTGLIRALTEMREWRAEMSRGIDPRAVREWRAEMTKGVEDGETHE